MGLRLDKHCPTFREHQMSKLAFLVAAAAVAMFFVALDTSQNQSFAKRRSDYLNGGYCPAGTCSKGGGN
jgi:hypothetical protein